MLMTESPSGARRTLERERSAPTPLTLRTPALIEVHLLQRTHNLYSLRRLLLARNRERGRHEGGRKRLGQRRSGAVAAVASPAIIDGPVRKLKSCPAKVAALSVIDYSV